MIFSSHVPFISFYEKSEECNKLERLSDRTSSEIEHAAAGSHRSAAAPVWVHISDEVGQIQTCPKRRDSDYVLR